MAASWRPACFRLRIGSTSISDPSKSTRVGVGGIKLNLLLLNECFSAEVDAARSRRRLVFGKSFTSWSALVEANFASSFMQKLQVGKLCTG